ncbi:fasciclin domain-containing protein [Spongiactinospora rosea]|uniref:Fasciclin domain-containing protein n=1 Tax=Spongiactinospora rosea TaxID=2248750 RepID=A0A366M5M4_9ACTN|nr:fasciclin domain-containing protein [Spongiactinospora rosea]RBQ21347.1 fasciclin domain-containing protein [Spongiactinospora rosea]
MKSSTVRFASGLAVLGLAAALAPPAQASAQMSAQVVSPPYLITPAPPEPTPPDEGTPPDEVSPTDGETMPPEDTASPEETLSPEETATPGETASPTTSPTNGEGAQPFGPACAQFPASGKGSLASLAQQPAASAVAEQPQLGTLSKAIDAAGLKEKLNSAENVTLFAPTDEAFQQIPREDLDRLLSDKEALGKLLSGHVVEEKVSKEDLSDGRFTTAAGTELTVSGSGDEFTVNDEAKITCGGIPVKNGTLFLIDKVLMPE